MVFGGVSLTVLYQIGLVLPSPVSGTLWVLFAGVTFLVFRLNHVPILSLSRISLVFYFYVGVVFLWTIVYPQVFIAYHATAFQTPDIFARANHLVAIGTAAFSGGWISAFAMQRQRVYRPAAVFPVKDNAFIPAVLLTLPFWVLSLPERSILSAPYGESNMLGAVLQINVFKSAAISCVLFALVSCQQRPTRLRYLIVLTLSVLLGIGGFGSGNRVEELGFLLGMAWVLHGLNPFKKLPAWWPAGVATLCVFMLMLGELRGSLADKGLGVSSLLEATRNSLQVFPDSETLRMKPTNNGDIALTLCVVIGLVETNVFEIDSGETFLRYARMTLPRSLNADRPEQLQVTLSRMGLTGGGLFILAEPYTAGGATGVLLVLLVFGAAIGTLEARFVAGSLTRITYALYLLLLSCVPRWFLYGIFSMYKQVLTGLLVLLAVCFVAHLFSRFTQDRSAMGLAQVQ